MRVLIVKMSSLGDVIHTLPALTDAAEAIPGIKFDWVVEEAFAEIPAWHPAVDRVIPIALRRWRKTPWRSFGGPQWKKFRAQLDRHHYDAVIDPQGLLKSAFVSRLVRAPRFGMDKNSARERLNPVVALLAMLLEIVSSCDDAALSPDSAMSKVMVVSPWFISNYWIVHWRRYVFV